MHYSFFFGFFFFFFFFSDFRDVLLDLHFSSLSLVSLSPRHPHHVEQCWHGVFGDTPNDLFLFFSFWECGKTSSHHLSLPPCFRSSEHVRFEGSEEGGVMASDATAQATTSARGVERRNLSTAHCIPIP
ncbi:hypothetical protein B0H65DRAFT_140312 [Neurospora tetraspora]|uniref:Uncharacterized protein n=1 Tax=Neurospora tetraspora TaxID=94610 RepID=A0AAE0MVE4_9PEZI|nr:hypothetical protein B0H65DRAFT_140312 [Neurospora tetraspora]